MIRLAKIFKSFKKISTVPRPVGYAALQVKKIFLVSCHLTHFATDFFRALRRVGLPLESRPPTGYTRAFHATYLNCLPEDALGPTSPEREEVMPPPPPTFPAAAAASPSPPLPFRPFGFFRFFLAWIASTETTSRDVWREWGELAQLTACYHSRTYLGAGGHNCAATSQPNNECAMTKRAQRVINQIVSIGELLYSSSNAAYEGQMESSLVEPTTNYTHLYVYGMTS